MHPRHPFALLLLVGCNASWNQVDSQALGAAPPELAISTPAFGSSWTSGEPIEVSASISDDLDAPETLLVSISSDLQGVVAEPTPGSDGTLDATLVLDAGTHTLTVSATDSLGNVGTAETTVRVLDGSYPSQPGLALTPTDAVTGNTLVAEILVDSVDPEGDAVTYVWSWTRDGADAGIAEPTVPAEQVVLGDVWEVTVYATDGTTESPRAVRSVTIGDAPADPSPVAISPNAPQPGDELSCTHTDPVDPEGADVTVTYAWSVGGVDVGISTSTLAGGLERGEEVVCTVFVDDGAVTGFDSGPVRIGNAPPTLDGVSISPTSGDRTATFTATATGAADPDGDSVSVLYRWLVNGVEAGTERTLAGVFSRDDTVVCEVTPTDGYAEGSPISSDTLVIADAAPGAPEVGFTRTEVVPGVPATCEVTVEATDIDGDALTYAWSWTVDGAAVSTTGDTLSTSSYSAGQVITCTATADDGDLEGGSGSASLTLGGVGSGDVNAADAWTTITGSVASAQFGKAVDDVLDMDGDGLNELIISSPRGDGGTKGAVFVFTAAQLAGGGTLTDTDASIALYGHANSDFLGSARGAAGVGDVDGDGLGDFLASSPYDDSAGTDAGQAYLMYGGGSWALGEDVLTASDARFRGNTGDWLGVRMAGGDLDGDGLDDVCVTAPYNDEGAERGGILAVYLGGGSRLSGSFDLGDADATVYGTEAYAELGWSLAALGDGDGDGYNDLGVGIFYADSSGTDAGTAAIMSGDAITGDRSFSSAAYLVVNGVNAGDRFGYDIGDGGDVDGDGLNDVLLGGYLNDSVGADAGHVAIFYGRSGLNAERDASDGDVIFQAEVAGDYLGGMLDSAGDWDDDGLGDLLLGATHGSGGGVASAGVGYLFLGRDSGTWGSSTSASDASVRFLGTAASDYLSDEAAGGLDVDGDGYGDLAIGAQGSDLGASAGGAVYLFKGP